MRPSSAVLLLEFNELSPALLDRFIEAGELPNFANLRDESDVYITEAAERPPAGGLLIFNRQPLSQASRALVREMFRLAWEREGWPLARMGFAEWDRLAAVAFGEVTAVDLPGRIRAVCRDRVVQLGSP